MRRRGAFVSGVIATAVGLGPWGLTRASAEPPPGSIGGEEWNVQVCRNQVAANRVLLTGPDVLIRMGRTSNQRRPPEEHRSDTCRQRSDRHPEDVAPRVIVAARGLKVDVSVAENWWHDLQEPVLPDSVA